jgi:hypothetical protein
VAKLWIGVDIGKTLPLPKTPSALVEAGGWGRRDVDRDCLRWSSHVAGDRRSMMVGRAAATGLVRAITRRTGCELPFRRSDACSGDGVPAAVSDHGSGVRLACVAIAQRRRQRPRSCWSCGKKSPSCAGRAAGRDRRGRTGRCCPVDAAAPRLAAPASPRASYRRERWLVLVRSRGTSLNQASRRMKFSATALTTCSSRVLGRPR